MVLSILNAMITPGQAWRGRDLRWGADSPLCFNPVLYRRRNLIEPPVSGLRRDKRVATQSDKLGVYHLAFVQFGTTHDLLELLFSNGFWIGTRIPSTGTFRLLIRRLEVLPYSSSRRG